MIKNLIFDCSDTLLRFGGLDWLREVTGSEERAMHIHRTMFLFSDWAIYDKGNMDGETIKEKLRAAFDDCDRELGLQYFDMWYRKHTMIEGIPELLCYYTASAAFCKYPKVPIFVANFRQKCFM